MFSGKGARPRENGGGPTGEKFLRTAWTVVVQEFAWMVGCIISECECISCFLVHALFVKGSTSLWVNVNAGMWSWCMKCCLQKKITKSKKKCKDKTLDKHVCSGA